MSSGNYDGLDTGYLLKELHNDIKSYRNSQNFTFTNFKNANMLQLKRPLAFIDLETTGINLATDRIVEIAIVKDSCLMETVPCKENTESGDAYSESIQRYTWITDEMVKDAPTFKQVAQ